MNSFWRYALFVFFGAVGVALALCLGLSSHVPGTFPGLAASSSSGAFSGTAKAPRLAAVVRTVGPVIEQVQPPITQQLPSINSRVVASVGPQMVAASAPTLLADNAQPGTQAQQNELMEKLRHELEKTVGTPAEDKNPPLPGGMSPAPNPSGAMQPPKPSAAPKSKPRITRIPGEGDNSLSIHIQDSDLRDVLALLSEQGGLNILPSPDVQGKVSASLNGVDIDTALDAILRSTGFVAHRDGKFIYVGTPQDFKAMQQSLDKVATRIYRMNYTRASDIQALVTPLLTPGVGTISVTAPSDEGMGDDSTKDGGNKFASGDSILVHDFVAVLDQIDQVVSEIDRKPAQVAIEAMILRVTLDDKYSFGVDFELLRNNPGVRFATGSPLSALTDFDVTKGGLKFAYLDGSTGAFVSALETIGDTDVIASPKVMVLDKARAEILIGQQLGYVNTTITETSTAQNVQFLEVGAQLRLRPFISSDGLVRMEVHPELSTGEVVVEDGLTLPNKDVTQVTTNIMVPDGCTVVIGGLMREDLATTTSQVPFFGSLPGIGWLFRDKNEHTQKEEIIVLITPHIVCEPDACCEGDKAAAEFHRRQAVYADQMSPLGKRYMGRKYYRLAQAAWAKGDQQAAMRFIDLAVHFDPESRAAIDLRTDIWNGKLVDQHTLIKPGMAGPPPMMGPGDQAPPMLGEPPAFSEVPWSGEMPPEAGPYSQPPPAEARPPEAAPRRESLPPGAAIRPQEPPQNHEALPSVRPVPAQAPSETQRQDRNQNPTARTGGMSTASLKPAAIGSGAPLFSTAAKPQPKPQPQQPTLAKPPASPDPNIRQASAHQGLDGDHLPPWMVDGLRQPAGAAAAPQNGASPGRLMPTDARPLTPEAKQ